MRILFEELADAQRAGGVEAATHALAVALDRAGVQINRRFPDSPETSAMPPDCVHIHGIWSPLLMKRYRHWRKAGVPCVVTIHGMLEPWALAHKRLKKWVAWRVYQKRLLNQAGALHATSDREAGNLQMLGLKPRIAMIPWGIEMPDAESEGRRSEVNWSGGSSTVDDFPTPIHSPQSTVHNSHRTALFVGRIYPVKGLLMLVEAWVKVRPAGWRMRIVGPDEAGHRAEVEAAVDKLGLRNEFEFTGALAGLDKQQAFASADLYLQPSHTENFGMAIGEAMAHGLPVITTQGAPWELLVTERCGWWVPVSVDGIAAALEDATRRSPEELAAMGARGRDVVNERFAWDRIARQFVDCYRWLIGQGERPDCVRQF